MNSKDEFSGMRELTSFKTAHSAFGEFCSLAIIIYGYT